MNTQRWYEYSALSPSKVEVAYVKLRLYKRLCFAWATRANAPLVYLFHSHALHISMIVRQCWFHTLRLKKAADKHASANSKITNGYKWKERDVLPIGCEVCVTPARFFSPYKRSMSWFKNDLDAFVEIRGKSTRRHSTLHIRPLWHHLQLQIGHWNGTIFFTIGIFGFKTSRGCGSQIGLGQGGMLRRHAWPHAWAWRSSGGSRHWWGSGAEGRGASRALVWARSLKKAAASSLQRPPASIRKTTRRHRRSRRSSGWVRSLFLLAPLKPVPFTIISGVHRCIISAVIAQRSVFHRWWTVKLNADVLVMFRVCFGDVLVMAKGLCANVLVICGRCPGFVFDVFPLCWQCSGGVSECVMMLWCCGNALVMMLWSFGDEQFGLLIWILYAEERPDRRYMKNDVIDPIGKGFASEFAVRKRSVQAFHLMISKANCLSPKDFHDITQRKMQISNPRKNNFPMLGRRRAVWLWRCLGITLLVERRNDICPPHIRMIQTARGLSGSHWRGHAGGRGMLSCRDVVTWRQPPGAWQEGFFQTLSDLLLSSRPACLVSFILRCIVKKIVCAWCEFALEAFSSLNPELLRKCHHHEQNRWKKPKTTRKRRPVAWGPIFSAAPLWWVFLHHQQGLLSYAQPRWSSPYTWVWFGLASYDAMMFQRVES